MTEPIDPDGTQHPGRVLRVSCGRDGREHLVAETVMTPHSAGHYPALCGHPVWAAAGTRRQCSAPSLDPPILLVCYASTGPGGPPAQHARRGSSRAGNQASQHKQPTADREHPHDPDG
ncbi:MAG: hypothetical protein ABR608_13955 [Pseudonocardiaceae bacterium]